MIWCLACLTCHRVGVVLGILLLFTHVFFSPTHFSTTPFPSFHDVSYGYDWSNSYSNEGTVYSTDTWKTLHPPVRVAGSMHSVSKLVTDTVITVPSGILSINNTHVTALAGTRIKTIQKAIAPYTLRGIGSIVGQTLGGAFSTSLAGIEGVSFTQFVTEIVYETPDGVTRTDDLYLLKDTMGMVGIIHEMTLQIFPNRDIVFFSEFELEYNDVHTLTEYDIVDSIVTNNKLRVITYNVSDVTNETLARPTMFYAFLWDLFGLPLLIPVGMQRSTIANSLQTTHDLHTVGAAAPLYGTMFVAYSIPMENCSSFLHTLSSDNIVRVKQLRPRDDACLSYTGHMCRVELYYPRFGKSILYDAEAMRYGGFPHWGKLTSNVSAFLHTFPCFKDVPVQPSFVNGYLKGEPFTPWDGAHRIWWTRTWQIIVLLWIPYRVYDYCAHARQERSFKTSRSAWCRNSIYK